jgi:hypothetical protein
MKIRCVFFASLSIAIICLGESRLWSQYIQLDDINFWSMSSELILTEKWRTKLDISPKQIKAIEVMRSDQEFEKIVLGKLETGNGPNSRLAGVFKQLDITVRGKLEKILTPQQVDGLRILKYRKEFEFGYTPFESPFVAKECKFDEKELSLLATELLKRRERLAKELHESQTLAARRVLDFLPEQSRLLFVQYAGNIHFPQLRIEENTAENTFAYPPKFKSLNAVNSIFYFKHLREAFTDEEQVFLGKLVNGYLMPSTAEFRQQNPGSPIMGFVLAKRAEGQEIFQSTASKALILKVCRLYAAFDFESDFRNPFAGSELCNYLKLDSNQITAIRQSAVTERVHLLNEKLRLNQEAFSELCKRLDKDSRNRMEPIFGDVWRSDILSDVNE